MRVSRHLRMEDQACMGLLAESAIHLRHRGMSPPMSCTTANPSPHTQAPSPQEVLRRRTTTRAKHIDDDHMLLCVGHRRPLRIDREPQAAANAVRFVARVVGLRHFLLGRRLGLLVWHRDIVTFRDFLLLCLLGLGLGAAPLARPTASSRGCGAPTKGFAPHQFATNRPHDGTRTFAHTTEVGQ